MGILDIQTPVGVLELATDGKYLREITFIDQVGGQQSADPVLTETRNQLEEYFAGERTTFDLPIQPAGTDFQRRVWQALGAIPFGQTITYLELAQRLGDPNCIRAAGRANGKNPLPIVVPCHRVIGSGGKLVGYRGGTERKRWLLKHEGALLL